MIRWRTAIYLLAILDLAMGLALALPLTVALVLEGPDAGALGISVTIALLLAGICLIMSRRPPDEITHREGFLIVGLGWINASLLGALPFWLTGVLPQFIDAFFESVSGFTTTGATVFGDIEGLPHGIILWRAMTQWLGGMGIILLSIAILPVLGVGGMQLYKAEVPGPLPERLKPRLQETAKTLWKVYVFFTLLEILLLIICGVGFFDATCHAFTTLATGGFSTRNLSIESFQNPYAEWVITLFMLIAGINFSLHYRALRGNPGSYLKSSEFRFFGLLFLSLTGVISVQLLGEIYPATSEALRHASFQVASILTTTGFTSTDYEWWPYLSMTVLLLLMFIGGSVGSTGGGIKCMRILVLLKSGYRELIKLIHPHAVLPLKMDGKTVPRDVSDAIWGFFILYTGVFVLACLIMAAAGLDLISAIASVAACLGNIGPGLGSVGPADNYSHIPNYGKWLLSFCMIAGRLEIYTLILLLVPEFWRK